MGVGGSATTDGGLGALEALQPRTGCAASSCVVACDVRTRFVDAAEVFGAAEGRDRRRRSSCCAAASSGSAQVYRGAYGVDVTRARGRGRGRRAGRRPGGRRRATWCAASTSSPTSIDLDERLEGADLVVTGEGFLDEQSFDGKVVGGVVALAAAARGAGAGRRRGGASRPGARVTPSRSPDRFGGERSRLDTLACIEEVVTDRLAGVRC